MAARSSPTSAPARGREAGVTLVEVLVVLALLGVAAGAVGLGLAPGARGPDLGAEARLLAARMRLASEEAVLTGRAVALLWSEDGYRFVAEDEAGAWAAHPVPLLAEPKALGSGARIEGGPGAFVVSAAALPAGPGPLALRLVAPGGEATVAWDGATARVAEAAP